MSAEQWPLTSSFQKPDDSDLARGPIYTPQRKIRERKISPKFFRPKFFRGRPRGMSVPKCLFFPGFGGSDRSFRPDVRRDVRLKTSVFGLIFRF